MDNNLENVVDWNQNQKTELDKTIVTVILNLNWKNTLFLLSNCGKRLIFCLKLTNYGVNIAQNPTLMSTFNKYKKIGSQI